MIIHNEEERAILREGGALLATILGETGEKCTAGTNVSELNAYAKERMEELGVEPSFLGYGKPPFPAVVCVSVNEGVVHGIPNDYVLAEGDILTIDGGIWHKGLCTDSAITVGVGKISKDDQRLIHVAQEARAAQINAAVAGNTVGDLGYASEQVITNAGYSYPRELGGHGVGRAVHEHPFIASYGKQGSGEVLREGMVLALEPIVIAGSGRIALANDGWLYETVDGSRVAQFEHTVIVGKTEAEVLTARNE